MYVTLFLNIVFLSVLRLTEFDLLIEKINLLGLFNVIITYSLAIYAKRSSKKDFYVHPSTIFILVALIVYNSVVLNKPLLALSVVLFLLFFILDHIYNSIELTPYEGSGVKEKVVAYHVESFKALKRPYREQVKRNLATPPKTTKQEKVFEEDEFMINMQLEDSLVLLGLSHDYALKQLKEAYKAQTRINHPKRFSAEEKNAQTIIMEEINNAKSYLEDRLKK